MELLSRKRVAIAVGILALAFPGAAGAAQTIGQTGLDGGACTNRVFVQHDLTSGPSYSPSSSGVITSWGAQANGSTGQTLQLTVLRQDADLEYTILRRDSVRTLANLNALNTFTGLRLPIDAGQLIGVYDPPGSQADCESDGSPGDNVAFSDVGNPSDGVPTTYFGFDTAFGVNAQAVVEPDTDRDVFGDESQDKCVGSAGAANGCPSTVTINKLKQKGDTKVKVTATVPGAGTLRVGSASDKALAGKAAKSLKAVTKALTATTTQRVNLTLKLTKSAIGQLEDAGKLKLKVKAVYTPAGGPPGSQTKKRKLSS
jgi:hypothetical protein